MKLPFITISLIAILLSSCSAIKVRGQKSASNLFESFSAGDEGTQYFIKPFELEQTEEKGNVILDVLFRHKLHIKDSAIINFTIQDLNIIKSVDEIKFVNAYETIQSNAIKFMFNEKPKKGFISRFTTKISLAELSELFKNNDWKVTIHFNKRERIYTPSRKSKKKIETLNNNLFILF